MKCEIKHWDDSKKKTHPVVFNGQPGKTVLRYISFLDEMDTKKWLEELGDTWRKLP